MSNGAKLIAALSEVKWQDNVSEFASQPALAGRLERVNYKIGVWSIELETADRGNLALSFLREAQAAGHYVACLMSLALYRPGAASMRAIIDGVLQYSYFRLHPAELETLRRDSRYFVDKRSIVDYHRQHTFGFVEKQHALGLISRLDKWYSETSAIIHGQEPGKWVTHRRLAEIGYEPDVCELATTVFEEAGDIFDRILLCTVDASTWYKFTKDSKNNMLKGLEGKDKRALGLTSA